MDDVTNEAPEAEVEADPSQEAETTEEPEAEGAPEEGAEQDSEPAGEPQDTYKVKVDGQILEVELDELLNGYQRQSHFTKAQQGLAAERDQLQQAEALWTQLNENPQETMQLLTEHFGDTLDNPEEAQDPEELRLREVESFMEQQREVTIQADIEKTVAGLKSEYGDFDEEALFQHALDLNVMDLGAALAHMQAQEQRNQRDDEKITQSKRKAAVATGGSRAAGSSAAPPREITSVKEALAETLEELGISSDF